MKLFLKWCIEHLPRFQRIDFSINEVCEILIGKITEFHGFVMIRFYEIQGNYF